MLNISPTVLDELTELLLEARIEDGGRWLSLSFDDGYEDARAYIASRAVQYPTVRYQFFVCPEKLEARAGFRWDLAEERLNTGASADVASTLDAPADVEVENHRVELLELGKAPQYELATLEGVKALQQLPNVDIGNHTNLHLRASAQPDAVVAADYRRSRQAFERLFGPQRHFAFPFGTPGHHFQARHVNMVRSLGPCTLWSTEARPFAASEESEGSVVPRFPVDGRRDAVELAGWVLARTLRYRAQGTKHRFG